MITRRSALIMLAGAALPVGVCAQDQAPGIERMPKPLACTIILVPSLSDPNLLILLATYGKGETETKFVIELQNKSQGLFRHVVGSHPARFFDELGKALAANSPRLSNEKLKTLPVAAAFLGPPTIRSPGGAYGGAPGDWYTTKLFLGRDQSEVYFNFNLRSGEAEFALKDEDYGNAIISELSKVIW